MTEKHKLLVKVTKKDSMFVTQSVEFKILLETKDSTEALINTIVDKLSLETEEEYYIRERMSKWSSNQKQNLHITLSR